MATGENKRVYINFDYKSIKEESIELTVHCIQVLHLIEFISCDFKNEDSSNLARIEELKIIIIEVDFIGNLSYRQEEETTHIETQLYRDSVKDDLKIRHSKYSSTIFSTVKL